MPILDASFGMVAEIRSDEEFSGGRYGECGGGCILGFSYFCLEFGSFLPVYLVFFFSVFF